MIATRTRGLAHLHAAVITAAVGVFFWAYAAFVLRYIPTVRLSDQVNLLPYFLCILAGMMLSARELEQLAPKLHALDLPKAVRVAGRQVVLMAMPIFTMMFATRDRSVSRLFLGSFLAVCWPGLTILNSRLPRALARFAFNRSHRLPTLFVGRVASLANLHDWITHKESLGIEPVGLLSDDAPAGIASLPTPVIGRAADLSRILSERPISQVVLLELPVSDAQARDAIEVCQEHGCRLLIHDNLAERYTYPLVPTTHDGQHFYSLHHEPLEDPLNRVVKRMYDLALAIPIVLLVLPPIGLWVWTAQRLQAPGPLFHVRDRRGRRGETFRMLKFRSMHVQPENPVAESQQAHAEDERVFPFGRFMRRRSLDELPQFWNVLVGDMSVVGPRPYMPRLDEKFREHTRGHRMRHLIKPGITGLAQSLGYRGEVLEAEMLTRREYWDIYYITHWSIWLDLQITARTLWQVIVPPEAAY
jgi:exopolysaccharide biosynthesis polyprenyl glycosylphosphotransferase